MVVSGAGLPVACGNLQADHLPCVSSALSTCSTTSGIEIVRPLDLIQELCGHRIDGDGAGVRGALGDDEAAIGCDLGDGKTDARRRREFREAQKFPPATCACRWMRWPSDGAGQRVPDHPASSHATSSSGPRTASEASDTRPQMTIRSLGERGRDPPAAEIGIGGDGTLSSGASGRPVSIFSSALLQRSSGKRAKRSSPMT